MTNTKEEDFIATPEQIDTSKHFINAFGEVETEVSAHYIVAMLQKRGSGWQPFTHEEIEEFYKSSGQKDGFTFNALINPKTKTLFDGRTRTTGGGFIKQLADNLYEVTPEFVKRAFNSSPKK